MYKFKKIDLSKEGISQCSQLLATVFAGTTIYSPEYLDWEYNQNPLGQAVGFNAFLNDELAAHYVTIPVCAKIFGKETKGLLSLNTATHPNHRGKKLFTQLADLTYQYGREMGYQFVVGVANANSTPGFINKLGFQLIAPLSVKISLGYFKNKKNKNTVKFDFIRIWDKETLAWRLSNPQARYHTVNKKDHFFITAPTKKLGIFAIIGRFDNNLLPDFCDKKSYLKPPQKIWIGIDPNIQWSKLRHFNLPEKLKPSPLNLIYKDLSNLSIKLDPLKIKVQAVDFDAY